jgi:hypothetical protein
MQETSLFYLAAILSMSTSWGFVPCSIVQPTFIPCSDSPSYLSRNRHTALYDGIFLPVPDNFFTVAGAGLGLALTISRSINRVALENRAWESRLEDARMAKLDEDEDKAGSSVFNQETYTELDLRRRDAENSQSAYGPEAMVDRSRRRVRGRTITKDRESDVDENKGRTSSKKTAMSDEEILKFESEFGITYDPYYDEPYAKDELPGGIPFVEDKVYGDRRYENGEVFYQDEENVGLYWRQGGKPRLKRFWRF